MTSKKVVFSWLVAMAMLFAMLFPQLHAVKHFNESHNLITCKHKQNNKHEITHDHNSFQDCYICGFNFTPFNSANSFFFSTTNVVAFFKLKTYKLPAFISFFSGSILSLRGPPTF